MKRRHILILMGIILFIIYAATEFTSALNPYVSIHEAQSSSSTVQVKGKLQKDADKLYYDDSGQLHFSITDEHGDQLLICCTGSIPENFTHAEDIIVIGKYKKGMFQAEKILTKCPSKYEKGNE